MQLGGALGFRACGVGCGDLRFSFRGYVWHDVNIMDDHKATDP